ncbi:recombinase family protein [Nocardia sp. R7R-8]|uniref:recombinase family protein n=1 Tax=Nocardia sp. R7R-8 TaxID=3459304 RepID=UPI00403E10F3
MAFVGLVRVGTSKQETQRQHDDLAPICVRVFEEKISGTLAVADRPGLRGALDYMRPGDILTVQEADRLGRNPLEGLIVLNDLFRQGVSVKIRHGIAAGEHTERSRAILARHAEGQSLREIARGVGVRLAVVHGEVKTAQATTTP